MKIWHFSDTHTYHGLLKVPEDIDIAIFSGDCSNPRDIYANEQEVLNFLVWYGMEVKAKYKIFVAGNHDTSIEAKLVTRDKFKEYGIIYLENESVELNLNDGWQNLANSDKIGSTIVPDKKIKIWGSPITPSFGIGWSFNKKRDKLHDLWQTIPDNTDIIISHGPPKGCLDLSFDKTGKLEFCGCEALRKRCLQINPKLVCFGHIHSMEGATNAGFMKLGIGDTLYSNGSVVLDGKFGKVYTHGNIFEI